MTPPSLRPATVPEISLAQIGELLGQSAPGVDAALRLSGVTLDSRQVRPGDLYAALPGARVHGARFAGECAEAGAVAVLTDPEGARLLAEAGAATSRLAVLTVADPRSVLGAVAAAIYGDPTAELVLIGVTGTNGKTTVTYLVEAGLAAAGHRTGLIGTVETRIADVVVPSVRTTPEAPDLQALFAVMSERGVDAAAMEVSSHALSLRRVDGCHFCGVAFTNLSQDHLDFHSSLEEYFEAKAQLFDPARGLVSAGSKALVAGDDAYGQRLAERHPNALTFGLGPDADWKATDIVLGPAGSTFTVVSPAGVGQAARVRLAGAFNVRNALCAIALLAETGTALDVAVAGVGNLAGVPGRMERVDEGQPFLAVVDYAHTPAAVTGVLETVRELVAGRVTVVLGCGGDRDRGKRRLMGAAAVSGADLAVLTADNPRSEDPLAILAEMVAGAAEAKAHPGAGRDVGTYVVEPDRAQAIALAVAQAGPGDAVVVAGKGHEAGQESGGVTYPFDDRLVLRSLLAGLA